MNPATIAIILDQIPNLISLIESLIQNIQTAKSDVTEEQLSKIIQSTGTLVGVANTALTAAMAQKK